MPISHKEKGLQIIAYFTTINSKPVNSDLLKQSLSKTLPSYMIPTYFYHMDYIPLTVTGKIDRKFIVDTFKPDLRKQDNLKPRNKIERDIATIWGNLLKNKNYDIKTTFAQAGGNSLLLLSLILKLQNKFKINIAINDIINLHTIEEQAEYIITNQQ